MAQTVETVLTSFNDQYSKDEYRTSFIEYESIVHGCGNVVSGLFKIHPNGSDSSIRLIQWHAGAGLLCLREVSTEGSFLDPVFCLRYDDGEDSSMFGLYIDDNNNSLNITLVKNSGEVYILSVMIPDKQFTCARNTVKYSLLSPLVDYFGDVIANLYNYQSSLCFSLSKKLSISSGVIKNSELSSEPYFTCISFLNSQVFLIGKSDGTMVFCWFSPPLLVSDHVSVNAKDGGHSVSTLKYKQRLLLSEKHGLISRTGSLSSLVLTGVANMFGSLLSGGEGSSGTTSDLTGKEIFACTVCDCVQENVTFNVFAAVTSKGYLALWCSSESDRNVQDLNYIHRVDLRSCGVGFCTNNTIRGALLRTSSICSNDGLQKSVVFLVAAQGLLEASENEWCVLVYVSTLAVANDKSEGSFEEVEVLNQPRFVVKLEAPMKDDCQVIDIFFGSSFASFSADNRCLDLNVLYSVCSDSDTEEPLDFVCSYHLTMDDCQCPIGKTLSPRIVNGSALGRKRVNETRASDSSLSPVKRSRTDISSDGGTAKPQTFECKIVLSQKSKACSPHQIISMKKDDRFVCSSEALHILAAPVVHCYELLHQELYLYGLENSVEENSLVEKWVRIGYEFQGRNAKLELGLYTKKLLSQLLQRIFIPNRFSQHTLLQVIMTDLGLEIENLVDCPNGFTPVFDRWNVLKTSDIEQIVLLALLKIAKSSPLLSFNDELEEEKVQKSLELLSPVLVGLNKRYHSAHHSGGMTAKSTLPADIKCLLPWVAELLSYCRAFRVLVNVAHSKTVALRYNITAIPAVVDGLSGMFFVKPLGEVSWVAISTGLEAENLDKIEAVISREEQIRIDSWVLDFVTSGLVGVNDVTSLDFHSVNARNVISKILLHISNKIVPTVKENILLEVLSGFVGVTDSTDYITNLVQFSSMVTLNQYDSDEPYGDGSNLAAELGSQIFLKYVRKQILIVKLILVYILSKHRNLSAIPPLIESQLSYCVKILFLYGILFNMSMKRSKGNAKLSGLSEFLSYIRAMKGQNLSIWELGSVLSRFYFENLINDLSYSKSDLVINYSHGIVMSSLLSNDLRPANSFGKDFYRISNYLLGDFLSRSALSYSRILQGVCRLARIAEKTNSDEFTHASRYCLLSLFCALEPAREDTNGFDISSLLKTFDDNFDHRFAFPELIADIHNLSSHGADIEMKKILALLLNFEDEVYVKNNSNSKFSVLIQCFHKCLISNSLKTFSLDEIKNKSPKFLAFYKESIPKYSSLLLDIAHVIRCEAILENLRKVQAASFVRLGTGRVASTLCLKVLLFHGTLILLQSIGIFLKKYANPSVNELFGSYCDMISSIYSSQYACLCQLFELSADLFSNNCVQLGPKFRLSPLGSSDAFSCPTYLEYALLVLSQLISLSDEVSQYNLDSEVLFHGSINDTVNLCAKSLVSMSCAPSGFDPTSESLECYLEWLCSLPMTKGVDINEHPDGSPSIWSASSWSTLISSVYHYRDKTVGFVESSFNTWVKLPTSYFELSGAVTRVMFKVIVLQLELLAFSNDVRVSGTKGKVIMTKSFLLHADSAMDQSVFPFVSTPLKLDASTFSIKESGNEPVLSFLNSSTDSPLARQVSGLAKEIANKSQAQNLSNHYYNCLVGLLLRHKCYQEIARVMYIYYSSLVLSTDSDSLSQMIRVLSMIVSSLNMLPDDQQYIIKRNTDGLHGEENNNSFSLITKREINLLLLSHSLILKYGVACDSTLEMLGNNYVFNLAERIGLIVDSVINQLLSGGIDQMRDEFFNSSVCRSNFCYISDCVELLVAGIQWINNTQSDDFDASAGLDKLRKCLTRVVAVLSENFLCNLCNEEKWNDDAISKVSNVTSQLLFEISARRKLNAFSNVTSVSTFIWSYLTDILSGIWKAEVDCDKALALTVIRSIVHSDYGRNSLPSIIVNWFIALAPKGQMGSWVALLVNILVDATLGIKNLNIAAYLGHCCSILSHVYSNIPLDNDMCSKQMCAPQTCLDRVGDLIVSVLCNSIPRILGFSEAKLSQLCTSKTSMRNICGGIMIISNISSHNQLFSGICVLNEALLKELTSLTLKNLPNNAEAVEIHELYQKFLALQISAKLYYRQVRLAELK